MSKKKCHKKMLNRMAEESKGTLSIEETIEIQAEAYYRAMKRLKAEETQLISKDESKDISFGTILVYLLFKPKKIVTLKREGQTARGLVNFLMDIVLSALGFLFRFAGFTVSASLIINQFTPNYLPAFSLIFNIFLLTVFIIVGGMFTAASKDIENIEDKDFIFTFSASIMAIFAFILAVIAIIK